MNEIKTFSPEQQVVLDLIAAGKSIGAAADAAGIHRNTVANWRYASEDFRIAYDRAHYNQVMACRDRAVDLAPEAMRTIMALMQEADTPPGVRLRAALEIQNRAQTLPPPDPSIAAEAAAAAQAAKLAQSAQAAQTKSETAAIIVILNQIMAELDRFIAQRAAAPDPPRAPGPGPEPAPPGPHDLPQAVTDEMLASLINLSNQLNPKAAHLAQSAQSAQRAPTKQQQRRAFEQLLEKFIEPPCKISFADFAARAAELPPEETTETFTPPEQQPEGNAPGVLTQ